MSQSAMMRELVEEAIEAKDADDDQPAQAGTVDPDRAWRGYGLLGDVGVLVAIFSLLAWVAVELGPVAKTVLTQGLVLLVAAFAILLCTAGVVGLVRAWMREPEVDHPRRYLIRPVEAYLLREEEEEGG